MLLAFPGIEKLSLRLFLIQDVFFFLNKNILCPVYFIHSKTILWKLILIIPLIYKITYIFSNQFLHRYSFILTQIYSIIIFK